MHRGSVGFLALYALDVQDEAASVALKYLAGLLALVVASGDLDLVVLAHWHAADAVFLAQLFAKRCTHELASNVRRCREVPLAILASGR